MGHHLKLAYPTKFERGSWQNNRHLARQQRLIFEREAEAGLFIKLTEAGWKRSTQLRSKGRVHRKKIDEICRNYNTARGCRYGDRCRFQHSGARPAQDQLENVENDEVECCVCFCPEKEAKAITCEFDHSICGEDVARLVNNACQPDAPQRYTDAQFNLRCPAQDCVSIHPLQSLAGFPQSFDKLMNAKISFHEAKVRQEMEAERIAEAKRQKEMSPVQREAWALKKDLEDNVLTLRCPGCAGPFMVDSDYNECAALKCQVKDCKASGCNGQDRGFCVWCMKQVDHDLHNHVGVCEKVPISVADPLFPGGPAIISHLTARSRKIIRHKLSKVSDAVRKQVLDMSSEISKNYSRRSSNLKVS